MNEELFDKVGKKLPYGETGDYVDALVERCAHQALKAAKTGPGRAKKIWITAAAAAAVAILAVTVTPKLLNTSAHFTSTLAALECNAASVNASADLSDVLSEMTYDQLTSVSFYLTDDIYIPEY